VCTSKLGAGLGLVGLVAHKLGAARVVLTDGDDSALQLMQANVAANVEPTCAKAGIVADSVTEAQYSTDSATAGSSGTTPTDAAEQQHQHHTDTVCCSLLQWGNAAQIQQALQYCNRSDSMQEQHSSVQQFDIVLGGEVIYDGNRADLDSLFQTVLSCTRTDSGSAVVFYMAFRQRLVPLDEVRHSYLTSTLHVTHVQLLYGVL
jgi:predicted nicotinamide N-methyase